MYDVVNSFWLNIFRYPILIFFWLITLSVILLIRYKRVYKIPDCFSSNKAKSFFILISLIILIIYSNLFPYYTYDEALPVIRYAPLNKVFYLLAYLAFGGPSVIIARTLQLVFYILGAIFLFRTVYLFYEKEVAFLAAAIYLFSPIVFSYASQAAVASTAQFFITVIIFYFLRFLKTDDHRDLFLASFFIGMGFLYRREILLTFAICFSYLIMRKIIKRDLGELIQFKVLSLSLISILPFLWMGGPRIYEPVWSNLITWDELIEYSLMIKSQVSLIVFILFVMAFAFTLFTRRDEQTSFMGYFFVAYYLFYTVMSVGKLNHRYVLTLYPAIAYFLASFIFSITQKIRWKYALKTISSLLIIYLIILSLIPRSSSNLITWRYKDFETQYFPLDRVAEWIKGSTEADSRILVFYIPHFTFYLERVYSNREGLNQREFILLNERQTIDETIYPFEELSRYCRENRISYVILPYSPNNELPGLFKKDKDIARYLKEHLDKDHIKVAGFNLEDNYIYIYKMNLDPA